MPCTDLPLDQTALACLFTFPSNTSITNKMSTEDTVSDVASQSDSTVGSESDGAVETTEVSDFR